MAARARLLCASYLFPHWWEESSGNNTLTTPHGQNEVPTMAVVTLLGTFSHVNARRGQSFALLAPNVWLIAAVISNQ
jgi:hypothetical protein